MIKVEARAACRLSDGKPRPMPGKLYFVKKFALLVSSLVGVRVFGCTLLTTVVMLWCTSVYGIVSSCHGVRGVDTSSPVSRLQGNACE